MNRRDVKGFYILFFYKWDLLLKKFYMYDLNFIDRVPSVSYSQSVRKVMINQKD